MYALDMPAEALMQRFMRLVRILDLINRGRCPGREDLAREFECSVRTVDNDIQLLRDNHYAIEFDDFRNGYINTNPDQKLPEFDLDYSEVFALTIGKDMLSEYSGTSLEPVLRSALDKIADRLPEKVRVNLKDFVTAVRFKPSGTVSISRKLFFDFADACDDQRIIDISYYGARKGQYTQRKIEPLRVVEHGGAWYCIAWCRLRNDIRMFALHRIQKYTVMDETFIERDGIDVDSFVKQAFLLEHAGEEQRYSIWFDPLAARYVRERQWHPSQEITDHLDGSLTFAFSATSLDEVRRWVLGFGASAHVLEPAELRRILAEEFEDAHKMYSEPQQLQLPVAARTVAASSDATISAYDEDSG